MSYPTVIEKPFAKNIECIYWQYSSKNSKFITGLSLTVLLWSDGIRIIPIKFMIYKKDEDGKPLKTKNVTPKNQWQQGFETTNCIICVN